MTLDPLARTQAYLADPLRRALVDHYHMGEEQSVTELLSQLSFWDDAIAVDVRQKAYALVEKVRAEQSDVGGISAFMHHYDLSSEEGVLLMCLAEALLRIPDKDTEYKLIRDKLSMANWSKHKGSSSSKFVNLATLGLIFTGKVLGDKTQSRYLKSIWQRLVSRSGEPIIRRAIRDAMKVLSEQFVLGQTIEEAISRSADFIKQGYCYSYDMLGEVALTEADAKRYLAAYADAIKAIGIANTSKDVFEASSISVKLSALYARYEFSCQQKAVAVLTERLRSLVVMAHEYNISLTVDAEECDRLDMSLDIVSDIFLDPVFAEWEGFGLAVQVYQKRAHGVLQYLTDLAKRGKKRIQVRLVKGAYWDSEIKHAQEQGVVDYPVFTRKNTTDANYIACAKLMLEHPDAIYSQFATHNAHTVAAVLNISRHAHAKEFEFQNLQGMGKSLHDCLVADGYRSRIYAPVGSHEDLLPYLVRRLLENGANSSFVNRIVDAEYSIDDLVGDPILRLRSYKSKSNPEIPPPAYIYADMRKNARGVNVADAHQLQTLMQDLVAAAKKTWRAKMVGLKAKAPDLHFTDVVSPTDHSVVGVVAETTPEMAKAAFERAQSALVTWQRSEAFVRAAVLRKVADLLESHMNDLVYLIVHEAGRTIVDAIEDVREAIDFCRYYADQGERCFGAKPLQGVTGEENSLSYRGRGVMVCISPWNFPAAIFTGQIAAALMAGNAVIAKSAEQTPLTAALIADLFYQAGCPQDVFVCVYGDGKLGAYLVSELPHSGVLFTGSNAAAWAIQAALVKPAQPIVPLIAETGGINAMIADSSALPEALVADVIASAFGSAGQRCSALRVLLVQEEILESVTTMLAGAMALMSVGDPSCLSTDVGPVIDQDAKNMIENHISDLKQQAQLIAAAPLAKNLKGYFVAPHAFLLSSLDQLKQEIFGPVLHVLPYKAAELDQTIEQINALGYGLTFGIHSRINESVEYIASRIQVGNIYVNRTMIGAVVGVQPFGGCGLSGTGPKAGGPNYMLRLAQEVSLSVDVTASGGNAALMSLSDTDE